MEVADALVVRPGDTLLLRLASNVTASQLEAFRERLVPALEARLPGVEVIMVGGVEQMAAYRPDRSVEGDPA
ncbi:hypothetical protein [Streptosporangium jomthongense]|uniref:Uncharacterized protein n=1 Tax=Streptosporangium jomthongense TaxID=1193683 RepID=A0ABV8FFY5_9ACTN